MNLIVVVFDTLRLDHVGAYGNEWIQTPHLDAFAAQSVVFRRAYPESLPTLPFRRGLYTGARVFPFSRHENYKGDFVGAPGWGPMHEERDTISEVLSAAGYRTGLISDCYHQFKPSKNFHRGFDQWTWIRGQESDYYRSGPEPSVEELERHMPLADRVGPVGERPMEWLLRLNHMNIAQRQCEEDYFAPQVLRAAATWLEQNCDGQPLFLTVESFDPHEPWDPPVYYRKLYDPSGDEVADVILSRYGSSEALNAAELKRVRANYAGEVTMVDRWFGMFMATVERLGLAENSVIVVVSDHGHCIGERGLLSKQGHPLGPEIADLVLMVRGPGLAPRRTEAFVLSHDIAVTGLKLLGVEPSPTMTGLDFSAVLRGDADTHRDHTTTGWGPFVMVREGKWWYNAFVGREAERLYDISKDPDLRKNVATAHPDVCRRLADQAVADAGEPIPEYLYHLKNQPGCTPLEPELSVD